MGKVKQCCEILTQSTHGQITKTVFNIYTVGYNHINKSNKYAYPFFWADIDVSEKQLVTVVVFSCPISDHRLDIREVANEA